MDIPKTEKGTTMIGKSKTASVAAATEVKRRGVDLPKTEHSEGFTSREEEKEAVAQVMMQELGRVQDTKLGAKKLYDTAAAAAKEARRKQQLTAPPPPGLQGKPKIWVRRGKCAANATRPRRSISFRKVNGMANNTRERVRTVRLQISSMPNCAVSAEMQRPAALLQPTIGTSVSVLARETTATDRAWRRRESVLSALHVEMR